MINEYDDTKDIGILIIIRHHACCFFTCNGVGKYYNDINKKIIDVDWKTLLGKYQYGKSLYIVNNDHFIWLDSDDYNNYEDKSELSKILLLTIISKNGGENDVTSQLDNAVHMKDIDSITDRMTLITIGCIKKSNNEPLENIKLLKKASDLYGGEYSYYLGNAYIEMANTGFNILQNSAKYNNADAQLLLGTYYANGFLPKNSDKAIEYLNLAAENYNHAAAAIIIPLYMEKGENAKNLNDIFKYIKILSTSRKLLDKYIEGITHALDMSALLRQPNIAHNSIAGDIYFKIDHVKDIAVARKYYDVVKEHGIVTDNMKEFYEQYPE